jgi:endonuclease YncB( thermonuclease family)
MQRPPEYPENEQPDEQEDDVVSKVYGPSQEDIDRSWEGYESESGSGSGRVGPNLGGILWKGAIVVISLVILSSMSIGILGPLLNGNDSPQQITPEQTSVTVLRVIDGRTIVVDSEDGEQTVRLIGVEALSFGDPFHGFAQEVMDNWIAGKDLMLEADDRDSDEQGRLLRYVILDGSMINAALIVNGLGRHETERPNDRYDAFLIEMERQARESEVGIWDAAFNEANSDSPQAGIGAESTTGPGFSVS